MGYIEIDEILKTSFSRETRKSNSGRETNRSEEQFKEYSRMVISFTVERPQPLEWASFRSA